MRWVLVSKIPPAWSAINTPLCIVFILKVTGHFTGVEEVSMNWIGRRSVTELEVSLN